MMASPRAEQEVQTAARSGLSQSSERLNASTKQLGRTRHKTDSPTSANKQPLFFTETDDTEILESLRRRTQSECQTEALDSPDGPDHSGRQYDSDGQEKYKSKKKNSIGHLPGNLLNKLRQSFGKGTRKSDAQRPGITKSSSASPLDKKDKNSNVMGAGIKHSHTTTEINENTDLQNPAKTIFRYPDRENGVFLLISNFTDDLKGYTRDREELYKFFVQTLKYTFVDKMNCTKAQIFEAIEEAIETVKLQKANRLIVIILTHGEEKGLHSGDHGFLKEKDENGEDMVTEIEEIVKLLKHDHLPQLKDHPKLVFIQSCSGEEVVKSAGGAPATFLDQSDGDDTDEGDFIFQRTLPVDTDLLVASATTKYNKAFVLDGKGSWFIRHMLSVFKNMHETHDVERMLKSVTLLVSEERKKHTLDNGKEVVAMQVPVRQSTLRKDCFL